MAPLSAEDIRNFEPYKHAVTRAFRKMEVVPDMTDALVAIALALYTYNNYPDPVERSRQHIRKCNYEQELEKRWMEKLERIAPYFFEEIKM